MFRSQTPPRPFVIPLQVSTSTPSRGFSFNASAPPSFYAGWLCPPLPPFSASPPFGSRFRYRDERAFCSARVRRSPSSNVHLTGHRPRFPGHARTAVPPIHAQPSFAAQLLLCKTNSCLSLLESTLPSCFATVHSKRLIPPTIPLESTLTKNRGRGGCPCHPQSFSTRYYAPAHEKPTLACSSWRRNSTRSTKLDTPVSPQPQSLHSFAHSFRHTWGVPHPLPPRRGGFPPACRRQVTHGGVTSSVSRFTSTCGSDLIPRACHFARGWTSCVATY